MFRPFILSGDQTFRDFGNGCRGCRNTASDPVMLSAQRVESFGYLPVGSVAPQQSRSARCTGFAAGKRDEVEPRFLPRNRDFADRLCRVRKKTCFGRETVEFPAQALQILNCSRFRIDVMHGKQRCARIQQTISVPGWDMQWVRTAAASASVPLLHHSTPEPGARTAARRADASFTVFAARSPRAPAAS